MTPTCWTCARIHGCKKVPLTREALTYSCTDFFPAAPEDVQARNCLLHEFGIGSVKTLRDSQGKKMSATNITNTIKAAVESGDVNELQRLVSGASVPHLMIPACALKGPQFVTAQVQGKTPEQKLQVLSSLLIEIAQERSSSRTEEPPFTPDAPAAEKPKAGRGRPRKDVPAEDNVQQAPSASAEVAPDLSVVLQNISENVARIGNHLSQIESRIAALETRVGASHAEIVAIRQDLHAQAQFLGLVG